MSEFPGPRQSLLPAGERLNLSNQIEICSVSRSSFWLYAIWEVVGDGFLLSTWEKGAAFQALGFALVQPWMLLAFGKLNSR